MSEENENAELVLRAEEVRVATQRVARERVRLRRRVVTEEQTVTVPVRREVVEVVREPLDGGAAAPDGDHRDESEVLVLHEERPVVHTEVVATERVWLRRNGVREEVHEFVDVGREELVDDV